MKDTKTIILFATYTVLFTFTLIIIALWQKADTAYDQGRQEQYVEVIGKIEKARKIIESIEKPDKSDVLFPRMVNSKGEMHPDLLMGDSLKQFVFNNCPEEVLPIFSEIVAYAETKKVRPEVVFAIGWADTQCGRKEAMTTPNNPGNVGNTDGGKRMGFMTLLDGWKAIVDTLNNQYMKGLTKLGQLSQGGRDELGTTYSCADAPAPYKCYATSTENWNRNLLRAMNSMSKPGEIVGVNYNFRT